jgi:hypothetical protein
VPDAADVLAGVDEVHLEAELAQPVQLVQAGESGTDEKDVEPLVDGIVHRGLLE